MAVTVAVEPDRLTDTFSPLVAVLDTLKPSVNWTNESSKPSTSLAPSDSRATVSVSEVTVCPASTVEAVAPLNRSTAEPPSVKVGPVPVAVSVGSSFTPTTLTVEATPGAAVLSLSPVFRPLSISSLIVTNRLLAVVGSSLPLL